MSDEAERVAKIQNGRIVAILNAVKVHFDDELSGFHPTGKYIAFYNISTLDFGDLGKRLNDPEGNPRQFSKAKEATDAAWEKARHEWPLQP